VFALHNVAVLRFVARQNVRAKYYSSYL